MDDPLLAFIRRVVRASIILLVIGVVLNDGYRMIAATSHATGGLKDAMGAAMDVVTADPDAVDAAKGAAQTAAAAQGAELIEYEQQSGGQPGARETQISLTVGARATKTILAAPLIGLVRKTPRSDWYSPDGALITLRETKKVSSFGGD
ncbi:MAG: hypothetical protein JXA36_05200 [Coriobacteriia bacterium]|nr:hypothetical protein [Coriobacteriia bacterium]